MALVKGWTSKEWVDVIGRLPELLSKIQTAIEPIHQANEEAGQLREELIMTADVVFRIQQSLYNADLTADIGPEWNNAFQLFLGHTWRLLNDMSNKLDYVTSAWWRKADWAAVKNSLEDDRGKLQYYITLLSAFQGFASQYAQPHK